jgi:hypothetical protein
MANLTITNTGDLSGATDDQHLVKLWLQSCSSANTRIAYEADTETFTTFVGKPYEPSRSRTCTKGSGIPGSFAGNVAE